MEQIKPIRYNRQALHDIDKIEQYISEKGYPFTAISYTNRIIEYIKTLKKMPERNTVCKFPAFSKRGFHCAVFEDAYIIVYQITTHSITIKRIIQGSRFNY